jgi:beta-lactamase superfamily II metal-dependent hydrolase
MIHMYELDFHAVGEGERSGDAITVRYTIPGQEAPIVGVIDAGFAPNGEIIAEHVPRYYGTNRVDWCLSTHPDADHINGMGVVVRELDVQNLLIHRPSLHGYVSNSGAKAAEELTKLVEGKGGAVTQPFTGVGGFDGSLLIAGPTEAYYRETLAAQVDVVKEAASATFAQRFGAPVLKAARRLLESFPVETNFGDAGGTNPRNNSSAILSLMVDGQHLLFFGDAGVLAINPAMDYLDGQGRTSEWPKVLLLPHHGSRRNLARDTIQRILGNPTDATYGFAVASVSAESDNPSPRVANAVGRRGYPVYTTSGTSIRIPWEAPARYGWENPVTPLAPLVETDLDEG